MEIRKLRTEEELMNECLKNNEIILYGCGEVGQTLLRRLNQRGIRVKGFIVTEKRDAKIGELPVWSAREMSAYGG